MIVFCGELMVLLVIDSDRIFVLMCGGLRC